MNNAKIITQTKIGMDVMKRHHESKRDEPYCEHCGKTITDFNKAKSHTNKGPFYETVYICYECLYPKKEIDDGR